MDAQAAQFIMKGIAAIGAGLAVLTGIGPGISEGLAAAAALGGISRNPEAYGQIRSTLIIGCALTETTGIYGLLIAILIVFLVCL